MPVGIGAVAEQPRLLGAQLEDLRDDRVIVGGPAGIAARGPHRERLVALLAVGRVDEERLDRGAGVGDAPLAGRPMRRGVGGIAVDDRLRHAGELRLVIKDEREMLLVGELVLREARLEPCELLVDRGQRRLVGGREPGAVARVALPVFLDEALLLGRQRPGLGRGMHRVDAREQARVLDDAVVERREPRRHRGLDRLDLSRLEVGGPQAIDGFDAAQRGARALERDDRVVEGRRRGIGRDRVDLARLHRHRGGERRLEAVDAHLVERRDAAIGAGPWREQHRRVGRDLRRDLRSGRTQDQRARHHHHPHRLGPPETPPPRADDRLAACGAPATASS